MVTEKQKRMDEAMVFIDSYHATRGIAPTVREVQKHLNVASSSTAYEIIRQLRKDGRITTIRRTPRSIAIAGKRNTGQKEG